MKKLLALALAGVMCVAVLAGCGGAPQQGGGQAAADSDAAYISANGEMVIGITEYEPMNYYDADGKLIGFDTEFAEIVCEKLGVTPVFQVIDWDMKETELKSKNIDCIWNGLTMTEERAQNMDFSTPYLTNKQCIVIDKANAATITSTADLQGLIVTAEGGSAGETAIMEDEYLAQATYVAADNQVGALMSLYAGNADAAIVDYTLASADVGRGSYENMTILNGVQLEDEVYAIGFRLGSDMTAKVNDIIAGLINDGTLKAIAESYSDEGMDLVSLYEAAIK